MFLNTIIKILIPMLVFSLLIVAICASLARAQQDADIQEFDYTHITTESESDTEDSSLLPKVDKWLGMTIDTTLRHDDLSWALETSSQKLDSFFGDERLYEELTETFASVKLSSLYERGGETSFDTKFRLRLDLPRAQQKLKLKFRLESEDDEFFEEDPTTPSPGEETVGDTDVNASLQFIFQETRSWNISLSPGLKVRDPLDPFVKLRMRRSFSLFEWNSRIIQTFELYESTGYGSDTVFIFERALGQRTLLRLSSRAYRNEDEFISRDFEVSQRVALFHALKPKVALSTEAGILGNTEPGWHHSQYFYNIRLRRDVRKGFVFLEIRPQIDFRHENHFHGEPSILLALEVLYGANYREPIIP